MNKWDKRFMEMARLVSTWSSCFQPCREVGAVIVRDKRVMTTGYNGAPQGLRTCKERGECLRRKLTSPPVLTLRSAMPSMLSKTR